MPPVSPWQPANPGPSIFGPETTAPLAPPFPYGSGTPSVFTRPIEPDILKINSKNIFSIDEAKALATTLLHEAGVPSGSVEVEGMPAAKIFVLRFKDGGESAKKQIKKVLDDQRIDAKEWKKHTVKDTSDNAVPAWINPDKNNKTIKLEVSIKKLLELLRKHHADNRYECADRQEGVVTSQWRNLVRVQANSSTDVKLLWNRAVAAEKKVDCDAIEKDFIAELGFGGKTEWS